jgi:hypothetical protein
MIKSFPVLFRAGTHGTWLAWFVNQHPEFPKSELEINPSTQLDYATLGGKTDWYVFDHSFFKFNNLNRLHTPKLAFKVMPHHEAEPPRTPFQRIIDESNAVGIIVPTIKEHNHKIAKERFDIVRPNQKGQEYFLHSYPDGYKWKTDLPVLLCDPLDLMQGVQEEYDKLLEFIDSEPLSDWKGICATTIGTFYNIS